MADTLVMLHGANGSARELVPLAALLPPTIKTMLPHWLGHGGRPPPGPDYGFPAIVDDLAATLDAAGVGRCFLFGYSIGGYVAFNFAHRFPDRVRGIATLATRHLWYPRAVEHLVHLATPERLTKPGNPRAAELATIHAPTDWRLVNAANRLLFSRLADPPLTDDDLRAITAPVLVLNGTADALVQAEESRALAALFPTFRLGLFDGSAHPLPKTPLDRIAGAIAGFVRDVVAAEAG